MTDAKQIWSYKCNLVGEGRGGEGERGGGEGSWRWSRDLLKSIPDF